MKVIKDKQDTPKQKPVAVGKVEAKRRTKSGSQRRGSGHADWHGRDRKLRLLGRAIKRAALPIPEHKEKALVVAVANGATGVGKNQSLAAIWKEWR